jgi:hypothetical protein
MNLGTLPLGKMTIRNNEMRNNAPVSEIEVGPEEIFAPLSVSS